MFKSFFFLLKNAEIYNLAISPPGGEGIFVQIKKQGRILRRTKKSEEFEGTSNKSPKNREEFRQGGGIIFLAGKNIYVNYR